MFRRASVAETGQIQRGRANLPPRALMTKRNKAIYDRYNHSEKGRAAAARYRKSGKNNLCARKYRQTEAYHINIWLYRTNPQYRLRNRLRMQEVRRRNVDCGDLERPADSVSR